MAKSLSDIFKGAPAPADWLKSFRPVTRTLPNSGQTYQSPVVAQPTAPTTVPVAPVVKPSVFTTPPSVSPPVAGANTPVVAPTPTASLDYSKYTDSTGKVLSPQEYADMLAKRATGGGVPNYAGDSVTQGPQTTANLTSTATDLNNQRNDIATGTTDPYGVAGASGIAYNPSELTAIEKAYAGVYDPALKDVFAKLDKKQKADAAALDQKNREAELGIQAKSAEDQIRLRASLDANAPYTLGKDQVRYGADGKPIAVGIGDSTMSGTYVAGSNPSVDAYVKGIHDGIYKASDVPDELKNLVAQGMATVNKNSPISQSSTEAISLIENLVNNPLLGKISGAPGVSSFFPGTQAALEKNQALQLKGILSLQNRQQLKGQGAISDFEFKVLGDASSALGITDAGRSNLSDTDFKNELNKLKLKLQVGPTTLTDDELIYLQNKNYTPEQIRSYSQDQTFNSVGNTTDSKVSQEEGNRPQRNNNPLNIKSSNFTAALPGVSGVDPVAASDGGKFLTFTDPQAGFEAAKKLITQPSYSNLSVDAALKRWSGGGYGAQIAPQFKDRTIGSLSDLELAGLLHMMAKREGFYV